MSENDEIILEKPTVIMFFSVLLRKWLTVFKKSCDACRSFKVHMQIYLYFYTISK